MVHRKSSRINRFIRTLLRRLLILLLIGLAAIAASALWIQLGREDRAIELVAPEIERPPPAVAPDTLRLITYNIAHARGSELGLPNTAGGTPEERKQRLERIGQELRSLSADIIVLQEVDFNTWWSYGMDQAAILAETANMPYMVKQRNIDTGLPTWRRWEFGNVLLSRLPIKEVEHIELPPYSDIEVLVAGNHDALAAVIDLGGGEELRVVAVHLEVRSEETRVQAAERLIRFQRDHAEPIILLGDFNSTPPGFPNAQTSRLGQNTIELLEGFGGFQRSPARGQATHRDFTFPTAGPRRIIDWIMPDQNFRIVEYRVLDGIRESDHLPVLATVRRR